MKSARSFGFSFGPFGRRLAEVRPAQQAPGLRFGRGPGDAARLRQSFRGVVPGSCVARAPDGAQVLLPQRRGRFNLASFVRVKQPPALAPTTATESPLAQFKAGFAAAVAWKAPVDELDSWMQAQAQAHLPGATPEAMRGVAQAHDGLAREVRKQYDELSRLKAQLPKLGLEDEVQAGLRADLLAAQRKCLRCALALALPDLFKNGHGTALDRTAFDARSPALDKLLTGLIELDGRGAVSREGHSIHELLARLVSKAGPRPPHDGSIEGGRDATLRQLAGVVDAELQSVRPDEGGQQPARQPVAKPADGPVARAAALDHAGKQLERALAWAGKVNETPATGEPLSPRAAAERETLAQAIRAGMADLRRLEASLSGGRVDDKSSGGMERARMAADLRQARRDCARAALALELPELFRKDTGGPALKDKKLDELLERLVALDDRIAEAGHAGCGVDQLVFGLSLRGRTRELAGVPEGGDPPRPCWRDAVGGLSALADSLIEAVGPDRDGSALAGEQGLTAELDGAIRALRVKATADFMVRQIERRGGTPTQQQRDAAFQDATAQVQSEMDVAKARMQLDNAWAMAGLPRPVGGLAGVKVDTGLVKALREKLGGNARKVGLIVAALLTLERVVAASPASRRLKADMVSALAARGDQAVSADDARFLKQRLAGLRTEVELAEAGVDEAERAVGELVKGEPALPSGDNPGLLDMKHLPASARRPAQDNQGRVKGTGTAGTLHAARLERLKRVAQADEVNDARWKQHELASAMDRLRDEMALPGPHDVLDETDRLGRLGEQHAKARAEADQLQAAYVKAHGAAGLQGGLSAAELRSMGLSGAESAEVLEAASGFARQGLSSAAQAAAALTTVNDVMREIVGKLAEGGSASEPAMLQGLQDMRDEDKALQLGELLLRNLTGDTSLRMIDARDTTRGKDVAKVVAKAMEPMAALWKSKGAWLLSGADAAAQKLVTLSGQLHGQRADARAALEAFNKQSRSHKVDLDRPAGLASCKKVREAIEVHRRVLVLLDRINTIQATLGSPAAGWPAGFERAGALKELNQAATELQQAKTRRDQLCGDLAGFDVHTLHRSSLGRRTFTVEDLAKAAKSPEFVKAVDAVIHLREGEGLLLEDIGKETRHLETLLDMRRAGFGPEATKALRDLVRAAILVHLGGTPIAAFRPGDVAEKIKATLASEGVPVDLMRPEIDAMLAETFGTAELNGWAQDIELSPKYQEAAKVERDESLRALEAAAPGSAVPLATRHALLKGIDKLKLASRVKLTAGHRVEMQTGSIPVEPTQIVGVNVKMAQGGLQGLEIGRSVDGYELVLKEGWDFKAGVDVSAKLRGWDALGLKVGVTASGEGSGYRVSGVALRFANSPEGREAMKKVLDSLLTRRKIGARDLAQVKDLMPLVEKQAGAKAGASAQALLDVGSPVVSDTDREHASPGVGARVAVSGAVQGTRYDGGNTNITIRKTEESVTAELSATASLSARATVPAGSSGTHSASTDVVDASISTAYVRKTKTKEVRDEYGQVLKGSERMVQAYVPPGLGQRVADDIGGKEFRHFMRALRESEDPERRKMAESIETLVSSAGPNDMLSMAFAVDERVIASANRLLSEARALRTGRMGGNLTPKEALARAQAKEKAAQAMIDDPASGVLQRVEVILAKESTSTRIPANLVFVKWSAYTEEKSEYVAAQIKPDPALALEVHDSL